MIGNGRLSCASWRPIEPEALGPLASHRIPTNPSHHRDRTNPRCANAKRTNEPKPRHGRTNPSLPALLFA
jgi:hypothetical protein